MSFTINPLRPHPGAVIQGLDLSQPLDDSTRQSLYDAWLEHGLLLFRGQFISPEAQLAISRCFGELELHPLVAIRSKEYPELVQLDSRDRVRNPVAYYDDAAVVGRLQWHKDLIYTAKPNRGALLKAVDIPPVGGETGFANLEWAYQELTAAMKKKIEELEVVYRFDVDMRNMRFGMFETYRPGPGSPQRPEDVDFPHFPDAIYPLVLTHPETGRKILNVSPLFLHHVSGMENDQGDAILRELVAHVVQPSFAYMHSWQPEDMILWDNWSYMHCARGHAPELERMIHRTTIMGNEELGRIAS